MKYTSLARILLSFFFAALFSASFAQRGGKLIDSLQAQALPDFAPHAYNDLLPTINEIRKHEAGKITLGQNVYRDHLNQLNQFVAASAIIKKQMSKNYETRNALLRSSYLQQYAAREMIQAEQYYWKAIAAGEKKKMDSLTIYNNKVTQLYNQALAKAFSKDRMLAAKKTLSGDLNRINADLKELDLNNANGQNVSGKSDVMARMISRGQQNGIGIGINKNGPPIYQPPVNPPGAPAAPVAISIEKVYSDSVNLSFYDRSDNEDGSRLWRSDDLEHWNIVASFGPIDKFSQFFYTDKSLQHDHQYAYRVETYNSTGSGESQMAFVYTKNNDAISIWRAQLMIKVADIDGAGLDAPVAVTFTNNSGVQTTTLLDYSIDDFERGTAYTYDLGFSDLDDLSDIEDITIGNTSYSDRCYVQEINFMIDQQTVYRQVYGTTSSSAFNLGSIDITHDMLRSSPDWQSLYTSQSTPLPAHEFVGTDSVQLVIAKDDIRSMVESIMGNLLNTDLKGQLKWKEGSVSSVQVTKAGDNKLHFHFPLIVIRNNWPDPDANVDFDISFTKSCSGSNIKIDINSSGFKTSLNNSFWAIVKTAGLSALFNYVVNQVLDNCTGSTSITQSIQTPLPQGVDCNSLKVSVRDNGDVVICCVK